MPPVIPPWEFCLQSPGKFCVQQVLSVFGYCSRFANPSLFLRMRHDLQTRTAQHGLRRARVRNPPVRGIAGVAFLDEVHAGKTRLAEDFLVPEVIVVIPTLFCLSSAQHGLEDQLLANFFYHFVERIKRITQVIEESQKKNVVELSSERINGIDRVLLELDL